MLRLKSDLFEIFEHACAGTLDQAVADWDRHTALGVVMAAANYPDAPRRGDAISGLAKHTERTQGGMVFHSGTAQEGGKIVTSGGRVLCVCALGDSVKMAQSAAYQALEGIRFDGMQFRRDIGHRAIDARLSLRAADAGKH